MVINKFKKTGNVNLPFTESGYYGDVDGLSLQNMFYARNGVFPSCFLFDYETRTNGEYG